MEITKELAHIVHDQNLFVHEVHRTPMPHCYEGEFSVSPHHPYLYENPEIANHVSGTTFLDVTRQYLKAITHLFYDAPLSHRFVIRQANMDFGRYGKLDVPILARHELSPRTTSIRGELIQSFVATVSFFQEGRKLGSISGEFSTFSRKAEDLLMQRQYKQAPVAVPEAAQLAA